VTNISGGLASNDLGLKRMYSQPHLGLDDNFFPTKIKPIVFIFRVARDFTVPQMGYEAHFF
jgi:hypothetical protein